MRLVAYCAGPTRAVSFSYVTNRTGSAGRLLFSICRFRSFPVGNLLPARYSHKVLAFLELYLAHILTHERRGIFFLADQEHVIFLGNDESLQSVDDS